MKKVLKKGFTLIELMVVIAIIGILATTLAPKLREQLAKAKDSKAVSFLGASRTIASSLMISQMTSADDTGKATVTISWKGLNSQMDVTTAGLIKSNGSLIIGGSKNNTGTMQYGGTVDLYSNDSSSNSNAKIDLSDLSAATTGTMEISEASNLHLKATSGGAQEYSTEKKAWVKY